MYILGIHLDPPFTRIALLRKSRDGIEIRALDTLIPSTVEALGVTGPEEQATFLPPSFDVNPLYIKKFKRRVVSGLSTKDFLIRSMGLKIASNKHIEEAIAFQSEAITHFNPNEILSVPLVQKKEKGNTEALLFTVPKEALKKHLADLSKLKIDPDGVSTIPLALCHFVRWKFPQLLDAFIVDLGSSEITCVLMENGKLKKAHSIRGGVEKLLSALLEDRKKILLKKEIEGAAKQIDLLLLKPGLNPHLTEHLIQVRQEVAKTYYSFCREGKKEVIFTGRTDAFIHLSEFLFAGASSHPQDEQQKFAASIGLALEQFSSEPLQLRREEFFPQKNWQQMGFYALLLIAASILFAGTLLSLGLRSSHLRKCQMCKALQGSEKGSMEERIDSWIRSIEKNNKEYNYILQAPKVTEVLSWISSHPLLTELKNEGDPIDLRDIRYQLTHFPKITAPKESYLAKVEIEFQFKNSTNARKFHEALRKGDDYVNPDLEIKWDSLNNGYRTSFFLKNRSPHVP